MNFLSVGDLALSFQNIRQNTQIKTELARLSQELASGQTSDLATATSGDFSPLTSLMRDLKANGAYAAANAEAELFATAMQTSLAKVHDSTTELGSALLTAGTLENPTMIQTTTVDAKVKFESVIAAFNTRVADRYAFSGAATDTKPLADADTILTALQAAISVETTAIGVENAIDTWFDTVGGGFETIGYAGSPTGMSPFRLSDSDAVVLDKTAADPGIREVLKGIATAALIGEGALASSPAEQTALARSAGQKMINAESTLVILRAEIGSAEARIGDTSARNIAEKQSLEIARNNITAIDPYAAATQLEAVNLQLETLYSLTVRMSRLSLAEYMR